MKVSRALLAGLVAVSVVFAQEAAKPAAAPAPAKAEKAAKALTVSGTVVSVDAIGNTIIVKTKKAEDTLSVTAETKIEVGGKVITLGEVKAETSVMVHYKLEAGKKVATMIVEKVAKKAAAPETAPAAK